MVVSRYLPLGNAVRGVDGGRIRCLDEMLGDDVDNALPRLMEVPQCILRLLQRPDQPNDEERRVMVDNLRVAEGRQIGRFPVLGPGAYERNGPRNYSRNQQFVVGTAGSSFFVRINFEVVLLQTLAAVICTVSLLPFWVGGLGVSDLCVVVEFRSGGLDLLKVLCYFEHVA